MVFVRLLYIFPLKLYTETLYHTFHHMHVFQHKYELLHEKYTLIHEKYESIHEKAQIDS